MLVKATLQDTSISELQDDSRTKYSSSFVTIFEKLWGNKIYHARV